MSTQAAVLEDIEDRLIRVETLLFKLSMHLGMNPKSGQPIRRDPINFTEGVQPDR